MLDILNKAQTTMSELRDKVETEIDVLRNTTNDLKGELTDTHAISVEALDNATRVAVESMQLTIKSFTDVAKELREMLVTKHDEAMKKIDVHVVERVEAMKGEASNG